MSNRYVIDGIVSDLKAGKSVHLINGSVHSARFQFGEVLASFEADDLQEVRRSNGSERITTKAGGKFTVSSIASGRIDNLKADIFVAIESLSWNADRIRDLLQLRKNTGADVIRA